MLWFVCLFVCLFVSRITQSYRWILTKFLEGLALGLGTIDQILGAIWIQIQELFKGFIIVARYIGLGGGLQSRSAFLFGCVFALLVVEPLSLAGVGNHDQWASGTTGQWC